MRFTKISAGKEFSVLINAVLKEYNCLVACYREERSVENVVYMFHRRRCSAIMHTDQEHGVWMAGSRQGFRRVDEY